MVEDIIGAVPVNVIVLSENLVTLLPASITMSPVEEEPMVNVCPLVVPRVPVPVRVVAIFPLFPEIEAVGVPELTFRNANFAEAVDWEDAPIRRSTVALFGRRAPPVCVQYELSPCVAIVIEPLPLVIAMLLPAVRVALLRVFPLELPMRSCPSVYEDCPVPPFATVRVPVDTLPVESVDKAPPENPDSLMSPVEEEPMVNVCLLVVARLPSPVMYRALFPLFAEIEAVGVPELMFVIANFAALVEIPPIRRSSVVFLAKIAPKLWSNGEFTYPAEQDPQEGIDPVEIRQVLTAPIVSFPRVLRAEA